MKKALIISCVVVVLVGAGVLIYMIFFSRNIIFTSSQYGFQFSLPKDFVQEEVSNPANILFTREEYLPFTELIPTLQILVAELRDISSAQPEDLKTLQEYIAKNYHWLTELNYTHQQNIAHGVVTESYCSAQGNTGCMMFALLEDRTHILEVVLNYPTQGEFSVGKDEAMESAFMMVRSTLSYSP